MIHILSIETHNLTYMKSSSYKYSKKNKVRSHALNNESTIVNFWSCLTIEFGCCFNYCFFVSTISRKITNLQKKLKWKNVYNFFYPNCCTQTSNWIIYILTKYYALITHFSGRYHNSDGNKLYILTLLTSL